MPTTTATELAQLGGLVTTDSSTSTVTVNGTLAATTITLPNNSVSTASISNSSVTAAKLANPQYTGFRNRIINGDMRIWQRGTSGFTTNNSSRYVADRMWMFSGLGVSATASQVTGTGLSGFPLATRLQRDSGNTGTSSVLYGQTIETSNCQDLAGQTVSVSFYARAGSNYSGATNSLLVYVGTGSGTDQGLNSFIGQTWTSQVFNLIGTATLTTSWQRFTFNFAVPAGTNEITPYVTQVPLGTAGANDFFDITGVQLEAGSTATDFERRPIGTELALCQRYFQSYGGLSSTDNICMGASLSTTVCVGFVQLPVSMRTSPSIGFTSVNAVVLDDNGAAVISNNILTSTSGTTSVYLSIPSTTTAGLTANRPARMSVNGINARVTWSAEL